MSSTVQLAYISSKADFELPGGYPDYSTVTSGGGCVRDGMRDRCSCTGPGVDRTSKTQK